MEVDVKQSITELAVPGLDRVALASLPNEATGLDVKFEKLPPSLGAHGEPVTTALMLLGPPAIYLLAAWLMKERKRGNFSHTIRDFPTELRLRRRSTLRRFPVRLRKATSSSLSVHSWKPTLYQTSD